MTDSAQAFQQLSDNEKEHPSMTMTKRAMISVALMAALSAGCSIDDVDDADRDARVEEQLDETADEPPTEGKLALLFGGDEAAIGAALDRAARHCAGDDEDRDLVADYVTFTIQELDEKKPGHGEDALTIVEAIAESAEAAEGMLDCSEVAATLLALMLPSN